MVDKALILKKLREYKNLHTDAAFARFLGISTQNLSAWYRRNTFDENKIVDRFPEINTVWILTGEGEMLRNPAVNSEKDKKSGAVADNYSLVPLYNFDAVAGMSSSNDVVGYTEYVERMIPFPDARQEDICMPITGNSMTPTYPPGSIVLLREVHQWREYFGYGHVYVLILTDGRRIIKEVQRSNEDSRNNVLCVSYNARHPDEELPKSMIYKVFKVIRLLTNEGF